MIAIEGSGRPRKGSEEVVEGRGKAKIEIQPVKDVHLGRAMKGRDLTQRVAEPIDPAADAVPRNRTARLHPPSEGRERNSISVLYFGLNTNQ